MSARRTLAATLTIAAALMPAMASDCTRTSTGLTPLNAPFFSTYQKMTGGLYPSGANHRPAAHEAAGLALASEVRPRNTAGAVDDVNGKIVFLSTGMSNTTQEFSVFKQIADQDPEKNPKLVIVDGAQGAGLASLIELTRPGGRILLQGYTPKQLDYGTGGPSALENLYTPAILQTAFADWTIEELVEYEEDISEGTGHKGPSALIGLVARKPLNP